MYKSQLRMEKSRCKNISSINTRKIHKELNGTDGLRLRCRQFYTSSNYPTQPSPRSSKKSFQKLLFRLWLRRSADQAPKTYPMAFQRMNGNVSLHELRTTSPIAQ